MVVQRRIQAYKFASKLTIVTFFLLLWAFVPNAHASNEQCIVANPEITFEWFDTFTNTYLGSVFYNRQISGTELVGDSNQWWLLDNIRQSPTTTGAYTGDLLTAWHSTSTKPTFQTIFNNYGAGIYVFYRNSGMNNITGCPGDNNTSQSNGYTYFSIDQQGNETYFSQGLGFENTVIPTVPIEKNIEIINPTYGTTTASTTFSYEIRFKTPFSIDFRPTTTRTVVITDAITGNIDYISTTTIPALASENIILNRTATTTQGSKYIRAYYSDQNGGIYSEIDEVFFNVATNTYYALTGLLSPRDNTSDLSQIDCTLFDVGCQFQKAITFLFLPPQNSLDKWSNLWQTIAEKKPFGYFTVTINQLEQLDVSGSSAFDLGTIPFMDAIFTPFRTLMETILWSIFAIYFYQRRLINLDI
jgi:hypothetical protein